MNKALRKFFRDSSTLFQEVGRLPKFAQGLSICTALVSLVAVCGFISFSTELIYYVLLAVNFLYLISAGGAKFNKAFLFLFAVIAINVVVVDIPYFFRPQQRGILFGLMTLTASSVLESELAIRFRRRLFKYVMLGLVVLSVGSFFCFFMGVNMMSRRVEGMGDFSAYSSHGGWFGGLTVHSMMLGPISMVVALFFYVLYTERRRRAYLVLFFMAAMSAVFASSRAALLGVAVAVAYSLIFGKFSAWMRRRMLGLLLVCALFTLPIADVAFRGVLNKHENRAMQNDGNLNSRQDKFDYRIAEFKKSPLLGVGFCAVDIQVGDAYSPYDGRIEPGTSHLSVLSMTGLLGLLAYLAILWQAYRNARRSGTPHSRLSLLCFVGMFVHAWFEGYVLSAGGFLAFLYWLILGQCIDSRPQSAKLKKA